MMPSTYFSNPLTFLIDTLFGLYMGIVALRLIMQWAQWEYHNQLVQFIIKATQVPIKFLRQFIPPLGRWDSATIVLLFSLALIKVVLLLLLQSGMLHPIWLVRLIIADIFSLFITLFSASIIIQAVLSWVAPHNQQNPLTPLLSRMNNPLLRPVRRHLPDMGGFDLSPLVVLLALQVFAMLVLPLLTGSL